MTAARVLWLQQHQLIPQTHQQVAYKAVCVSVDRASEAGDVGRALQLFNAAERFTGGERRCDSWTVTRVAQGVIGGQLRRACAAGDVAAVAQLERLTRFGGLVFQRLEVGWIFRANAACALRVTHMHVVFIRRFPHGAPDAYKVCALLLA
jgi:hypothetical protein